VLFRCGKSYVLHGNAKHEGLIVRTFKDIQKCLDGNGVEVTYGLSAVETLEDELVDLLAPASKASMPPQEIQTKIVETHEELGRTLRQILGISAGMV
jgi:hypothetical protein